MFVRIKGAGLLGSSVARSLILPNEVFTKEAKCGNYHTTTLAGSEVRILSEVKFGCRWKLDRLD